MGEIDRAAIRARIEHCKAYRFGMIGVIARQDAPDLLAALEDAERERDALAAVIEQVRALLDKPVHPYGDKSVPMWTERASLRDLYGETFVDALDAILRTTSTVDLEAVKAEAAAPARRFTPEQRADLVDFARVAIVQVWADVGATTAQELADNVVSAQEFAWLAMHFPVDRKTNTKGGNDE